MIIYFIMGVISVYIFSKLCFTDQHIKCDNCGVTISHMHKCSYLPLNYRDLKGYKITGVGNGNKRNRRLRKTRNKSSVPARPNNHKPVAYYGVKLVGDSKALSW